MKKDAFLHHVPQVAPSDPVADSVARAEAEQVLAVLLEAAVEGPCGSLEVNGGVSNAVVGLPDETLEMEVSSIRWPLHHHGSEMRRCKLDYQLPGIRH